MWLRYYTERGEHISEVQSISGKGDELVITTYGPVTVTTSQGLTKEQVDSILEYVAVVARDGKTLADIRSFQGVTKEIAEETPEDTPEPEPKAPAKKTTKTKAKKAPKKEEKEEPEEVEDPVPAPVLWELIQKKNTPANRSKIKAIITEAGVERVSDLDREQRVAVYEKVLEL